MLIFQIANKHLSRATYQKGGGDNGAGAQADAQKEAIGLQREQWNQIQENLKPFLTVGAPALQQLQSLISPEGQATTLQNYFKSDQYKQMADAARYQQLAAAEATGGLGGSATANTLASIAPTLGQNYLSNQLQNYGNLANIGMSAATGQATAGQNFANNTGQLLQGLGSINAARAQQPSGLQAGLGGAVSGAASGAMLGSVVPGIGTVAGGIGGAVLGGLSSFI